MNLVDKPCGNFRTEVETDRHPCSLIRSYEPGDTIVFHRGVFGWTPGGRGGRRDCRSTGSAP